MFNWNEAFKKNAHEFEVKEIDSVITPVFARNLRLKLKLSQRMFAKILGISEKTIEKWEQGKNPIKGTSSRLLYLLNLHEDLLDDLYVSKREDELVQYQQKTYIKRIVRKKVSNSTSIKDMQYTKTKNILFTGSVCQIDSNRKKIELLKSA